MNANRRWWMAGVCALFAAVMCGCPFIRKAPDVAEEGEVFASSDHKVHAVWVYDESDDKKVSVYLLDEDLEKPVATTADRLTATLKDPPKTITFQPLPDKGDPSGSSSRFVATDAALEGDYDIEEVVINVTIDGKSVVFHYDD